MRSKYHRTFFHPSRTVVHATAQRRPGLVGVDLLGEWVASLGDDRAHVRGEHPHVRHQGGRREDEHRPGVVSAAVGEH